MKTNEELAIIIARQTPENNPVEIKVNWHLQSMDDKSAEVARFNCGANKDIPAVIYDDETCFTPYDWEESVEWENVKWFDHEHRKEGIILNGLPRIF